MSILPGGFTVSTISGGSRAPPVRTANKGWTLHASRRNVRFLQSIPPDSLTGYGFAVTLTIKHCPPSAADWARVRTAWLHSLRRLGLVRCHWVTEWQRRGCPHLHAAVWFPADGSPARYMDAILSAWVRVASDYGAAPHAQHVAGMDNVRGWLRYIAKHAARGIRHYQRAAGCMPAGWQSTGRVWGHVGQFVTVEAVTPVLDDATYFAVRRLTRSAAIAYHRSRNEFKAMARARNMLTDPVRVRSSVRAGSAWFDMGATFSFLQAVQAAAGMVDFRQSTRAVPQSRSAKSS